MFNGPCSNVHLENIMIFYVSKLVSDLPPSPKNGKKLFYVFIMCFRALWVFLKNLLRGCDPGRPPCWEEFPTFTVSFMAPLNVICVMRALLIIVNWIIIKEVTLKKNLSGAIFVSRHFFKKIYYLSTHIKTHMGEK